MQITGMQSGDAQTAFQSAEKHQRDVHGWNMENTNLRLLAQAARAQTDLAAFTYNRVDEVDTRVAGLEAQLGQVKILLAEVLRHRF